MIFGQIKCIIYIYIECHKMQVNKQQQVNNQQTIQNMHQIIMAQSVQQTSSNGEKQTQLENKIVQQNAITNKKGLWCFVVTMVLFAASVGLNGYFGWKSYQIKDIGITAKKFNYSSTCSSQGYEIDLSGYTGYPYTATINMVPSCSNSTAANQSRLLSDTTCLKYDGNGSCCSWCYNFDDNGECSQKSSIPPNMHTVSCAALDSTTNQYKLTTCLATLFENFLFGCVTVVILLISTII